jgi:hypothetical protein
MKRLLFALLFLSLGMSAVASAQTPAKPAEPTASVSGRVTLDGKPVAGAKVAILGDGFFDPPLGKATTDAAGRFRIGGLPDGSFTLAIAASAFVGESDTGQNNGKNITLAPGEAVEDLELKLRPGGVITGRVTDSEKLPVIDQPVTLFRFRKDQATGAERPFPFSYNGFSGRFKTDDRGLYRIYGLPPGRYVVAVGDVALGGTTRFSMGGGGDVIPGTFHPGVTDVAQAAVIELDLGEVEEKRDVVIGAKERTFTVTGKLVDDETGAPVSKMVVGVNARVGGGIAGAFNGMSDSKGEFRLTGVKSGQYDVVAQSFGQESDYFSVPTTIDVRDDDVKDVTVRMKRGATVSGRIEVTGGTGPTAFNTYFITFQTLVRPGEPFNGQNRQVDADGSFRVSGLKPGTYQCRLFKVGSTGPGLRVVSVRRGDLDVTVTGLEIGTEAVTDLRVIAREAAGKVRGEIRFVGGEVPAGSRTTISLRPTEGNQSPSSGGRGEVDQRGRFLVEQLLPGTYTIRILLLNNQSPTELKTFTPNLVTVPETGEATLQLTVDLSSLNQPKPQ